MTYFLTILAFNFFAAASEPSDFELMMKSDSSVFTKESDVTVGGIKYRKVEYKGKIFHVTFTGLGSDDNLQVLCEKNGKLPAGTPLLIEAKVQVIKRNYAFVEGLQQACSENKELVVVPAFRLGIALGDNKKDFFKNKKVFLDLLFNQIGAGADF